MRQARSLKRMQLTVGAQPPLGSRPENQPRTLPHAGPPIHCSPRRPASCACTPPCHCSSVRTLSPTLILRGVPTTTSVGSSTPAHACSAQVHRCHTCVAHADARRAWQHRACRSLPARQQPTSGVPPVCRKRACSRPRHTYAHGLGVGAGVSAFVTPGSTCTISLMAAAAVRLRSEWHLLSCILLDMRLGYHMETPLPLWLCSWAAPAWTRHRLREWGWWPHESSLVQRLCLCDGVLQTSERVGL